MRYQKSEVFFVENSRAEMNLIKLTLVASDDEEWVYIQGDVNGAGWLRIEEFTGYDMFIGLSNAD